MLHESRPIRPWLIFDVRQKMPGLKQYDVVRVLSVLRVQVEDAPRIGTRSPRIGDTGTIVEILRAADSSDSYMVEAVEKDGTTLWLTDFPAEALEVIVPHETA
jgi:hypothetical protein